MKAMMTSLLFIFSSTSMADQCVYNSKATATKAAELVSLSIANAGGILNLCQLCGTNSPEEMGASQVEVVTSEGPETLYSVAVDGLEIDLAYTYVNINENTWVNLGVLSSCEATSVSLYILSSKAKDGSSVYTPSTIK